MAAAFGALLVVGCGEDDFENDPRPATAVNLTGVIQPKGVTIGPNGRGAGAFLITVSNQTDDPHTVTLEGISVEETVGPIQPQDTATIQRTLAPGTYEVRAGSERAVGSRDPAVRAQGRAAASRPPTSCCCPSRALPGAPRRRTVGSSSRGGSSMAWRFNILVVANVTADSPELIEALLARTADDPCSFTLVVPAPVTGSAGREAAAARLNTALARMRAAGLDADGAVGDHDVIAAVLDAWDPGRYDEIVVCTLPTGTSKWLQVDLPHRSRSSPTHACST